MNKLVISIISLAVSGSVLASTNLMLVNGDAASSAMDVTYKICSSTSWSIDCTKAASKTVNIPGRTKTPFAKNYINITIDGSEDQSLVVTEVKASSNMGAYVVGSFPEELNSRTCFNQHSAPHSQAIILDTLDTDNVFCNYTTPMSK